MSDAPYIARQTKTCDAIVVGFGVTGGWAAKELTEQGLDTLIRRGIYDAKKGRATAVRVIGRKTHEERAYGG